ncbi:MAG TPA: hypothetical protein VII97_04385, partial [Anaerolineales bacterium]
GLSLTGHHKDVHQQRNSPPGFSSRYFSALTSNFTASDDGKFKRKIRCPRAARASKPPRV